MGQFTIKDEQGNSTSTRADYITIPTLTTAQITTLTGVVVGSKVFNSTTGKEQIFNGAWKDIAILSDIPVVTGSTQLVDGTSGFVPAPVATEQFKVLKGNGGWSVKVDASIFFLNQTTNINTTTLFTCPQTGLYEIQIIGSVTSPIGNRNVTSQAIAHVESGISRTKSIGAGVNTNNLNSFSTITQVFQCDAGTTINYSNFMSGATGSYNVRFLITKLN